MAIPSVTLRDRLEMFENAKRVTDKVIRDQHARIAELEAPPAETHEEHDARVQAALAAWRETMDSATVDEEECDTEWGAMSFAILAADKARPRR